MASTTQTDLQPIVRGAVQAPPLHLFWRRASDVRCIHCDIIFGSPKDDCYGSGICKVVAASDSPISTNKRNCKQAPAIMTVEADRRMVTLVFFRAHLCVDILRTQFRNEAFYVPHAAAMPAQVNAFLGLPAGASILPGHYTIEERSGYFRVAMQVA